MLADPKARRLSTEFFGQWLGFYQFDQFKGVDTSRFPEFTQEVKSSMYDEAVSFFEYVVRNDRPVSDMLHADYDFLNKPLAKYYGIAQEVKSKGAVERVEGAGAFNRGGVLRLGAILTDDLRATAHQSGSPRRLGAAPHSRNRRASAARPTPARIPADDKNFGGLSVRDRLQVHKRNATCATCHLAHRPARFPARSITIPPAAGAKNMPMANRSKTSERRRQDRSPRHQWPARLSRTSSRTQVQRTLAHKLVGYALGRTLQLLRPAAGGRAGGRIGDQAGIRSQLIGDIVASKQFRNRDNQDDTPCSAPAKRPMRQVPRTSQVDSGRTTGESFAASFSARGGRRPGASLDGVAHAVRAGRRRRAGRVQQAAAALRHHLLLERHQAGALVGQGRRRRHGVRSQRAAARGIRAGRRLHQRALQPAGLQPIPARTRAATPTCSRARGSSSDPSDIRVGTSMDQVLAAPDRRPHRWCPAWRSASSPTSCAWKTACR